MVGALSIELLYMLVIVFCCIVIAKHTRCLYNLSFHQGIKYFAEAFIFWGSGFVLRFVYILGVLYPNLYGPLAKIGMPILQVAFEYLLTLGGFFLVYSLIWRQIDQMTISFLAARFRIVALHALALSLALADTAINTFHFLYIVQIVALGYAGLLTYDHWKTSSSKSMKDTFASLYLIALCAAFVGYLVNYAAEFFIYQFPWVRYITYLFTSSVFGIIMYGVLRIVHSQAYCERCCPYTYKRKQEKKHGKKTRKA